MKTTWLKGCMPTMDLVSISHYFIDRLTIPELDKLKAMAIGLDSQTVPIGSNVQWAGDCGDLYEGSLQGYQPAFWHQRQSFL